MVKIEFESSYLYGILATAAMGCGIIIGVESIYPTGDDAGSLLALIAFTMAGIAATQWVKEILREELSEEGERA
jgi:hypothetical protein